MKTPTLFLAVVLTVALVACSDDSESAATATATPTPDPAEATPGESEAAKDPEHDYPRYVAKYLHPKDGEVETSGSPLLAELVDDWFQKFTWSDLGEEASYRIELDGQRSLAIKNAPGSPGEMVAVWMSPGMEAGREITVTRQSEPIADQASAISLLKTFLSSDGEIESSQTWKITGRGMAVPFD